MTADSVLSVRTGPGALRTAVEVRVLKADEIVGGTRLIAIPSGVTTTAPTARPTPIKLR